MEALMKAVGLSKTYKMGEIEIPALKSVDFEINKGELVVILGQSGAGKSTLLNLIGGMDFATDGSLIVNGTDIAKYSNKELIKYRRNEIGFVFQFYNLMPNLTALENVELACELKNNAANPKDVLEAVGLGDKCSNFPSQLSGGEQQRVSIARAIAKNSDIILCDEPTGALDYETGKGILKLLADEVNNNKTVIIVTHNSEIANIANHLIKLRNGKIIEDVINPNPKRIEDVEW